MPVPTHFLLPAAVLALVTLAFSWSYRRSREILANWADRNGYQVLSSEFRWFFKGPYFWKSSKNQTVFRVIVEDETEAVRTAWVRCGSYWWGVFVDEADVIWDEIVDDSSPGV